MLLCPKCHKPLLKEAHCWRCEERHAFDIAKRGYVHLLLGHHRSSGDDKEMVRARTYFLRQGYYAPLQQWLCACLQQYHPSVVIDAGCGEGYYTNALPQVLPDSKIYGFDMSKYAIDEACKARSAVMYCVSNAFHMPLPAHCADAVLSVFAPYSETEIIRVLKADGIFVRVAPGKRHLYGLKKLLYEQVYENAVTDKQPQTLELLQREELSYPVYIEGQAVLQALFHMTPYYWRTPSQGKQRLQEVTALETELAFLLEVYRTRRQV